MTLSADSRDSRTALARTLDDALSADVRAVTPPSRTTSALVNALLAAMFCNAPAAYLGPWVCYNQCQKKCARECTTVDATKAVHRGKHGCKQSFAQHSHQAVRCPQVVRGGHAAHGASRRVHNARNTWSNSHRQHVLQHLSLIAVVDEGCNERLDSSIARNRQLVL
jgi:hypothetical protein